MGRLGTFRDFWRFLLSRKKYVLAPVLVILLGMLAFALLAEIPVLTPFIYALF